MYFSFKYSTSLKISYVLLFTGKIHKPLKFPDKWRNKTRNIILLVPIKFCSYDN